MPEDAVPLSAAHLAIGTHAPVTTVQATNANQELGRSCANASPSSDPIRAELVANVVYICIMDT